MHEEILRSTDIFAGLPKNKLAFFNEIIHERTYSENEVIFEQNSRGNELYIIKSGCVTLKLNHPNQDNILTINKTQAGEFFGEFALVDNLPRTASAYSRETTTLLIIKREDFFSIIDNVTDVGYIILKNLLKVLTERIRQADEQLQLAVLMGDITVNK